LLETKSVRGLLEIVSPPRQGRGHVARGASPWNQNPEKSQAPLGAKRPMAFARHRPSRGFVIGSVSRPGAGALVVLHKSDRSRNVADGICPGGTIDTSPAIYRWVTWSAVRAESPVGTTESRRAAPAVKQLRKAEPPVVPTGLSRLLSYSRPQQSTAGLFSESPSGTTSARKMCRTTRAPPHLR